MSRKWKTLLPLVLALLIGLTGCQMTATPPAPSTPPAASLAASPIPSAGTNAPAQPAGEHTPDEEGIYTSAQEVAAYLLAYGRLPGNFITKAEARKLGWPGGDLRPYARDKCIGGDRFGNYEGLLPKQKNRLYFECDIDTLGKASRGAKRLVYSNDGLIYYTQDHYKSFKLLYGEDGHAAD